MPAYDAICPKGHKFTQFQSFADYDKKLPLLCPDHNVEGNRLISKPMVNGTSSFRLGETETIRKEFSAQLGRRADSFKNAKEVDAYCEAKGLQMVDKDWQPSSKIIKDREEAGLKKLEEKMMKELSQHSSVILPDGTEQPLGH